MNTDEFRELLSREPFEPFRIHVTNGLAYEIRNPGLVVPMRNQLFVALPDGERWVFISHPQVAAVEALTNGRLHRRRPKR